MMSWPPEADRSLTTGYIPTEAGSMTYRLIENLNINEIHIFHNSTFSAEMILTVSDTEDVSRTCTSAIPR